MVTVSQFKKKLEKSMCPFCDRPTTFYSGLLGYEAQKCMPCGLTVDHHGIHLE